MAAETVSVRCCIVGGGPAGMMLGLLLARAGVEVLVLEKHADFLRDFRGDTIHPSTLEVMHELGLLEEIPGAAAPGSYAARAGSSVTSADGRRLLPPADPVPLHRLHAAMGFSRLFAEEGGRYPTFQLLDADRGRPT